jgi:hypothetical protein
LLVPGFDVKSNTLCHFVLSLTQSAIFAKTDEKNISKLQNMIQFKYHVKKIGVECYML